MIKISDTERPVVSDAELRALRSQGLSVRAIAARTGLTTGVVQYRVDGLVISRRCARCPRRIEYMDRKVGRNALLSREDFCAHCGRPTTQRGEQMGPTDGWIAAIMAGEGRREAAHQVAPATVNEIE